MNEPYMSPESQEINDMFRRVVESSPGLQTLFEGYQTRDGLARQAMWTCRDGYIVAYTTERIKGGPNDGKFAVMVYRPYGTGARSGKKAARSWRRVYLRAFTSRKMAKKWATKHYWAHDKPSAAETKRRARKARA